MIERASASSAGRWGIAFLFASLVLTTTGCGTICDFCYTNNNNRAERDRFFDTSGPHIYGGVQVDIHLGDPDYWGGHMAPCAAFFWIDFPISAALDTAALIFTVPYSLLRADGPDSTGPKKQ
jgi:hypothetical protein